MAQGLDKIPAFRIPKTWSAEWYSQHIREVLAFADIRNAIEGGGIIIEGQSDQPATISAETDVLQLLEQNYVLATPSGFLPNERVIQGEQNYLFIDDDGPGADITVGIVGHSIDGSKLRNAVELSIFGRAYDTAGSMEDIQSSADDTLPFRRNDGSQSVIEWGQLYAALAPDGLWPYAKLQDVSAASKLLGRGDSGVGPIEEITLGANLTMTGTTLDATPPALTETILTAADETATLVNSRQLLAGTNVAFDDTTPGERTINVSTSGASDLLTYLTEDDETAGLPNSRQLLAGTNITFDDTTPGERTINATAGSPTAPTIITDATTARTLSATDYFNYVRMTNAAANVITVPKNATLAIPVGTIVNGRQADAGQTSFSPEDGTVTINVPSGYIATTRAQHANWSLIKVATNEWDLAGDLSV